MVTLAAKALFVLAAAIWFAWEPGPSSSRRTS